MISERAVIADVKLFNGLPSRWLRSAAIVAAAAGLWAGYAPPGHAFETSAREALLVDATTWTPLLEKDAFVPAPPASMSKLMTLFMVFEQLHAGRLSLDDTFPVSDNAWRKGGAKSGSSTMFLEPGARVRVEDLLHGVIIQSGNDACIVLAEGLASSEEEFAHQMTGRARELGMKNSTFKNASGWPEQGHVMSAWDLALLSRLIIERFPEYYKVFADKQFTYNGIRQGNRNPLLYTSIPADGLKTGHTVESGYSLTASAPRGNRRLILVLNGVGSIKERAAESERLLDWGFHEFENYLLFTAGASVGEAAVWLGEQASVPLTIENKLVLTLPRTARAGMKVMVAYEGPVPAPIAKGQQIAVLRVTTAGALPFEVPLLAAADVPRLGFLGRISAALKSILWGASV